MQKKESKNDSHESGRGSDVGQRFQTRLDAFTRDTMYARYGVEMRRLRGNDETLSETTSRERAKVGEGQRHIEIMGVVILRQLLHNL